MRPLITSNGGELVDGGFLCFIRSCVVHPLGPTSRGEWGGLAISYRSSGGEGALTRIRSPRPMTKETPQLRTRCGFLLLAGTRFRRKSR